VGGACHERAGACKALIGLKHDGRDVLDTKREDHDDD
jgi:hypothetical protein